MNWITWISILTVTIYSVTCETSNGDTKTEPKSLHGDLDQIVANKTTKGEKTEESKDKETTPLELGDLVPNKEKFSAYLIEATGGTNSEPAAKPPNATTIIVSADGKRPLPAAESFLDYLQILAFGDEGKEKVPGELSPDPGPAKWAPKCEGKLQPIGAILPEPKNEVGAPANCIDKHPLCPFWETRGWCLKGSSYMKEHCSGACDTTCAKKYIRFNECKDQRKECHTWQLAGQCALKPFFMIWQCPAACKHCAGTESFTFEYTLPAFTCQVQK